MKKDFIPVAKPSLTYKEYKYVEQAVKSGWISSIGEFVEKFEYEFAKFVGTKYCIAVSNGTAALHLALKALDIKEGDEVIVPSLSFVAVANAVVYCGAVPVFVDSNPDYWCMEPIEVKKAITPKTKAIIVVHVYGHPADMDSLVKIAKQYNLKLIEDVAEAHGAEYKNRKLGSIGDIGVFSFYGNKIITTGEGGAIVTNNKILAKKIKFLKDHAMDPRRRYWHPFVGFNYRMTNLQAAIGVAQLERVKSLIKERNKYLELYKKFLADIPSINLNPKEEWASPVNWMVCIDMRECSLKQVEEVKRILKDNNIDIRPFFVPLYKLPPYKMCKKICEKKVAEKLSQYCFNLPSGYGLKKRDIKRICELIKESIK